jgi:hypothetical protein
LELPKTKKRAKSVKKKLKKDMTPEEKKEAFHFCESDDDSVNSTSELDPVSKKLVDCMHGCREWFVEEIGFLFKLMAE